MNNKIKINLSAWSLTRFLRLALGTIILVQGLINIETLSIILGGAFAGMSLLNIGCNGACPINTIGTNNKSNEPEFEEVVIKK